MGEFTKLVEQVNNIKDYSKEVRSLLKKQFKGIKFKVASDYDNIKITWIDGVPQSMVKFFLSKHKNENITVSTDRIIDNKTYENTRSIVNNVFLPKEEFPSFDDDDLDKETRSVIGSTDFRDKVTTTRNTQYPKGLIVGNLKDNKDFKEIIKLKLMGW
jgi:hypothetical protein